MWLHVLLTLTGCLVGCAAAGCHRDEPEVPAGPARSLPLLESDGVHVYVREAYEAFAPAIADAVAARSGELVDAGMDSSRHLLDWAELQPTPDTIVIEPVIEAMDAMRAAGLGRQFVNISVIDSGGPEAVPAFVSELIASGAGWDDPRITEPFRAMLSEIVPAMVSRGMYMIGFANEPGGYFEDDPEAASSLRGFVRSAVEHTRSINESLATTIVFAGPDDVSIGDLMPLIDVATFNAYAYELETDASCDIEGIALPLYRAAGPSSIGPLLDSMIGAAQGRLVCIQEFGRSTGWGDAPETIGPEAGLRLQAEVMAAFVEALWARRAHFRTVCLWTLNDHTRSGMAYLVDAIEAEGLPACYASNIAEIFGPTGLVRSDEAATKKPAFDVLRTSIMPLKTGAQPPLDVDGDGDTTFLDVRTFLRWVDAGTPAADRVWPLGVLDAADAAAFVQGASGW